MATHHASPKARPEGLELLPDCLNILIKFTTHKHLQISFYISLQSAVAQNCFDTWDKQGGEESRHGLVYTLTWFFRRA